MEVLLSPEFMGYSFLNNAQERNLKIADYLDQTAVEAVNVATIWRSVAETVLEHNVAEADNDINWLRLIQRPEWTIYSKNIPKSRLDKFFENISTVLGKRQSGSMDYFICKIGSILQKGKLTKEILEEEFKIIKEVRFFNKDAGMRDEILISDSIEMMNNEAKAISAFSSEFRTNLFDTPMPAKRQSNVFTSINKILFLKRITQEQQLTEFMARYNSVSGLNVSEEFLKEKKVYAAFNFKGRMCGGFVLGNTSPYRTIEVFAGEQSKKGLYDFVEGTSYCELNCFWLSVKNRKGFWSYWFWLLFAVKVSRQKEKMLIYGTIAKSLANIYGYPKKSRLLHKEELMFNGKMKPSWIFIGARADFFVGVLETFIYKLRNNRKKPVKYKRVVMSAEPAPSAKAM